MKKLIAVFAVVALLAGVPALAFAATSQQAECPGQGVCAQGTNFVDEDGNGVCDNRDNGACANAGTGCPWNDQSGDRSVGNGNCPVGNGECLAGNGNCPRSDDGTCPAGEQGQHGNSVCDGSGQGNAQGGMHHGGRGAGSQQ